MSRVGSGIDMHPFAEDDRPLVLAGVEIADSKGLAGHSDGDVATHAVIDAVLGAAGLGDIGERFGTERPELAGANSLGLLREVVPLVEAMGFKLVNVDLTIVAQQPTLAPHREAMRMRLSGALKLNLDAVSVKFTTTDQLGSIGRGEGIGAWAVCSIDAVGIGGLGGDTGASGGGGLLGGLGLGGRRA